MSEISTQFMRLGRQKSPQIILLEGPNGSGKSSISKWLMHKLREHRLHAISYSDPGGTTIGERIREIVKDPAIPMCIEAEFLAYSAARCELACKIKQDLKNGRYVILDRWWPSTWVYQGLGGINQDLMYEVFARTADIPLDARLSFVLQAPVPLLTSRVAKAQGQDFQKDRFESKGEAFMKRIVDRYEQLADSFGFSKIATATSNRFKDIWKDRDITKVQMDVFTKVKKVILETSCAE